MAVNTGVSISHRGRMFFECVLMARKRKIYLLVSTPVGTITNRYTVESLRE